MLLATACAPLTLVDTRLVFDAEPEAYQSCPDSPTVPPHGAHKSVWANYVLALKSQAIRCREAVLDGAEWRKGKIKEYQENQDDDEGS